MANPQSQSNFRPEQTKMAGLTESIELRVVGQDGSSIHFYMNQVLHMDLADKIHFTVPNTTCYVAMYTVLCCIT